MLLARGRPILYVGRRGRSLITFPNTIRDEDGALSAALASLRHLPRGAGRGLLVIEKIDGVAAAGSPLLAQFQAEGYALDYRGLIDVQPVGSIQPGRASG